MNPPDRFLDHMNLAERKKLKLTLIKLIKGAKKTDHKMKQT